MNTNELLSLSIDDIRLILKDQRDLYSPEELNFLEKRLDELCSENKRNFSKEKELKKKIPSKIACPKCDGENPSSNKVCQYCSYKFKEKDYYQQSNDKPSTPIDENETDNGDKELYIIAFLLPIVGIILGLIYMGKDKDELGKSLIIFSIVTSIIFIIIAWLLYANLLRAIFF